MEELVQIGVGESSVLGINFRDCDGVTWNILGEGSIIGLGILFNSSKSLCDSRRADKSGNVRVVAES